MLPPNGREHQIGDLSGPDPACHRQRFLPQPCDPDEAGHAYANTDTGADEAWHPDARWEQDDPLAGDLDSRAPDRYTHSDIGIRAIDDGWHHAAGDIKQYTGAYKCAKIKCTKIHQRAITDQHARFTNAGVTHGHSHRDANAVAYTDYYGNSHSEPDADTVIDTNCYGNSHGEPDADTVVDTNCYRNSHGEPDADTVVDIDRHGDSLGDHHINTFVDTG